MAKTEPTLLHEVRFCRTKNRRTKNHRNDQNGDFLSKSWESENWLGWQFLFTNLTNTNSSINESQLISTLRLAVARKISRTEYYNRERQRERTAFDLYTEERVRKRQLSQAKAHPAKLFCTVAHQKNFCNFFSFVFSPRRRQNFFLI